MSYSIELFGGPMDGQQEEVETLENWILVHSAPSLGLMRKFAGTDKVLPVFKDYYTHKEDDTRLGDTGKIIYIYRFEKKEPDANPEL